MFFMDEDDDQLKLLYLLSGCCEILPPSCIKLRSYLNIYLSNVADQHNLKLPKRFKNRNKACPYCYSPWSSDIASFKLLPSKKSKFFQTSNTNNEGTNNTARISELRNTLVLKCKICLKNSRFSLVKKKLFRAPKEEIVNSIGRKKKKKTSDLSVNLRKADRPLQENISFKKKKRKENTKQTSSADRTFQNHSRSQSNLFIPLTKSKQNSVNEKNFVHNSFATQTGSKGKFCRKNDKKLLRLKEAIKEEKDLTKKTLKDFLTLI